LHGSNIKVVNTYHFFKMWAKRKIEKKRENGKRIKAPLKTDL
jgi:hypothetical protein